MSYTVDGYDEKNKTIYEFNGCYWHGCKECFYNSMNVKNKTGKIFQQLYDNTTKRQNELINFGYKVKSIWEHEWNELYDKNILININNYRVFFFNDPLRQISWSRYFELSKHFVRKKLKNCLSLVMKFRR